MSDPNLGWVEPSRREIRKAQRLAARRAAALDRVERSIQQKEARTELAQSYKRLKDEQRRLREARAVAKTEEKLIRKQMKEERENAAMLGAALARAAAERQAIDDILAGKISSSDVYVEYESVLSEVNAAKAKLQSAKAETKEVKRRSKLARKRDRLARKAVDILAVAEMDKAILAADIDDVVPAQEQSLESTSTNRDQAVTIQSPSSIAVATTGDDAKTHTIEPIITPAVKVSDQISDSSKYPENSVSPVLPKGITDLGVDSAPSKNTVESSNSLPVETESAVQESGELNVHITETDVETHTVNIDIMSEQKFEISGFQDQAKHGDPVDLFEKGELPVEMSDQNYPDRNQENSPEVIEIPLTGNPTRSWGWSGDVKVSYTDTEFVEPDFDDEISTTKPDAKALQEKIAAFSSGDRRSEIGHEISQSEVEINTGEVEDSMIGSELTPNTTILSKRDQRKLARIEKRAARAAARSERREEHRIAREASRLARDKVKSEKIEVKNARRAKSSEEREKKKTASAALRASALLVKQQSREAANSEKDRVRSEQAKHKEAIRAERHLLKEKGLSEKDPTLKDKRIAKLAKAEEKKQRAETNSAAREKDQFGKGRKSEDSLSQSNSHEGQITNEIETATSSDNLNVNESSYNASSIIVSIEQTGSLTNGNQISSTDEDRNESLLDSPDTDSVTRSSKRKASKNARAAERALRIEARSLARRNREEEKLSKRTLQAAEKAAQREEREAARKLKRDEIAEARQAKAEERNALKQAKIDERNAKKLAKQSDHGSMNSTETSDQQGYDSVGSGDSTKSDVDMDAVTRQEIRRLSKERRAEEKRRRKEAKNLLKGMNEKVTPSGNDAVNDFAELESDQDVNSDVKSKPSNPSSQEDNAKLLRKAERVAGRAAVKAAKRDAKAARAASARADKAARKEAKLERILLKKAEQDKRRNEIESSRQQRRADKIAAREEAKESRASKRMDGTSRRDNRKQRLQTSEELLSPRSESSIIESKDFISGEPSTTNVSETKPDGIPSSESDFDSRFVGGKSDKVTLDGETVTNTGDSSGWSFKGKQNEIRNAGTEQEIANVDEVKSEESNLKAAARTEFDIEAAGGITHSDSQLVDSTADFSGVDTVRDGIAAKTKGRGLRRWVSWIVKKEEAEETEKLSKETSSEARRAAKEEAAARKEAEKRAGVLQKQEALDAAFEAKQLRKLERVREKAERNRAKDEQKRTDHAERTSAKARADEIRRNSKIRHEIEERERREEREQLKADKNIDGLRNPQRNAVGMPADELVFDESSLNNISSDIGSEVVEGGRSFFGSLRDRSESRRRLRREILEARNDNSSREGDDGAVLSKEERRVLRQQLKEERKRISDTRKSREEGEKQERRDRRNAEKSDRRAVEASNKAAGAERERLVRSFKNTRSEEKARKKEAADNTKAEQRRIKELRKAEVAQKRADEKAAKNSVAQDKKYRKEVRRQQKKKVNQQRSLLREETKIARRARRIDLPDIAISRDEPALGPAYNWDAESGMYNAVGAGNDIDPVAFDLPEPLPRR